MEPIEELRILVSQLVTSDLLIQEAKEILKESNHPQPPLSHLSRPSRTTDHVIYQFLTENNGGATKREELFDVFGSNEEVRRIIREKLLMMERFGLITIQGDVVTIRQARP